MSKLYTRLLGLGALLSMLGANPAGAQTIRRCGTEEANEQQQLELKRLNPGYNPARSTSTTPPPLARTAAITYTLPVVVHVIHNGEAVGTGSNISQAQVQSQLDVLNEDYRNLNPDGATVVPAVYQSRRGDLQVQFVLAQRDPSGNAMAEPGIDRVNRNTKGFTAPPYTMAYNQSNIKPQTYWNPEQYINIWVENLGNGLLGYAQFPDNNAGLGGLNTSGGAANTDGVVVLYTSFGSRAKNPTGNYGSTNNVYDKGRTLTHELGHWFSLRHIWGDANCGNDYCADTPTQQKENYGCVAFPQITCNNGTGDMSQNYMDYSDDRCMAMFSVDQADRVQRVMANGTPRRANLVNSPALCASVAAISINSNSPVCAGSSINLTATGPAGATYAWTGPNGYTSTDQNPVIANATAAMAGNYTVRVTPSNQAVCPNSATVAVVVNPTPPVPTLTAPPAAACAGASVTLSTPVAAASGTLPNADFNSGLPTGWAIGSTGTAGTEWQVTTGNTFSWNGPTYSLPAGFTIDNSRFAVANSDAGQGTTTTNTTLTTPSFSTTGYSALSMSFSQVLFLNSGSGAVEVSVDGGTTWVAAATYTTTQGNVGANQAATATINLASYLNQSNVKIRWHYQEARGYLWAIDNVAFTGTIPTYTYNYTLVSGNGLPATTNTPSISVTPTQNSVYRLTVTYPGGSCGASQTVAIAAIPAPPVPVIAASQSQLCGGGTSTLSATNLTGTGYTYKWELVSGDGLPATTTTATITVAPTRTSVYKLTVTNSCGASASSNPATGTSTVTVVTNDIQPYPVPFGNDGLTLAVSTCTAGPLSVQIFDSMGRRVYDRAVANVPVGNNNILLPGSQFLATGKYTLKVQQGSQQNLTFNVVRL